METAKKCSALLSCIALIVGIVGVAGVCAISQNFSIDLAISAVGLAGLAVITIVHLKKKRQGFVREPDGIFQFGKDDLSQKMHLINFKEAANQGALRIVGKVSLEGCFFEDLVKQKIEPLSDEEIRELLDRNADVNAKNIKGHTHLFRALFWHQQNEALINRLLEANARYLPESEHFSAEDFCFYWQCRCELFKLTGRGAYVLDGEMFTFERYHSSGIQAEYFYSCDQLELGIRLLLNKYLHFVEILKQFFCRSDDLAWTGAQRCAVIDIIQDVKEDTRIKAVSKHKESMNLRQWAFEVYTCSFTCLGRPGECMTDPQNYSRGLKIILKAYNEKISFKKAAITLKYFTAEDYDAKVGGIFSTLNENDKMMSRILSQVTALKLDTEQYKQLFAL